MKKLLFVGDAGCPSGFGRATHEILERVRQSYDVTVLGINYRGDPHPYPYPIYAAGAGGDSLGVGRLLWLCERVHPDVIVVQNDGWFIPYYIAKLRQRKATGEYYFPEHASIPVAAAVAVDGKNFRGDWIKDVSLAVFWTQFGLNEARVGGYAGQAAVIPLGVDSKAFYPTDKLSARMRKFGKQGAEMLRDQFIVGNVNRNQPRKRWDLTIKYFAEWVRSRNVKDATLFLHTAPTGDESINVQQLARYYGITDRLALYEPEIFYGVSDESLRDTYNCFDACITTTQGEGFGLTTLEAMACGVPCIVPDWAALGDWTKGAAAMVPCSSTTMQSFSSLNGSAVIGGVPDQRVFVDALDLLYRDKGHREMLAKAGLARAAEERFSWQAIGEAWLCALDALLRPEEPANDEIWQDLRRPEDVPA